MFALLYLNIYYIVILAWIMYYLYESFKSPLPYTTCDNSWNSANCYTVDQIRTHFDSNRTSSIDEFWKYKVLSSQHSSGIEDPGHIVTPLAFSLLVVWLGCYFAVFRGIKISGKVVYFTVLFPYVLIVCFIIRGFSLEGSFNGILFYIKPDVTKLSQAEVTTSSSLFKSFIQNFSFCPRFGSMPLPKFSSRTLCVVEASSP